jgi:hypothetical protein
MQSFSTPTRQNLADVANITDITDIADIADIADITVGTYRGSYLPPQLYNS